VGTRKRFLITKKHVKFDKKTHSPIHPDLATPYNNIGLVYDSVSEYEKAVSFYEESIETRQKSVP